DLLRRSASRVPHRLWACDHLCHFPLCTALPCALVGRHAHEYYWHSVTLGLASDRPSRVPSLRNVLERRRLPIHPLQCPRWASAITQGVPSAKVEPMARDGVGIRCAADECAVPPLEIGIHTIQSSPYRSGVAGPQRTHLPLLPALPTCSCPLALSGLGELFASESWTLNSGHLWWQFRPCVTRRTLSPHPAQHLRSFSVIQLHHEAFLPISSASTVHSR